MNLIVNVALCVELLGPGPHDRFDGGAHPRVEERLSDIGELTLYGREGRELTPIAVWRPFEEVWETTAEPHGWFERVEVRACAQKVALPLHAERRRGTTR